MTPDIPQASIVVPLMGGLTQALRCLEAIAALPPSPSFEVIVVDDASVGLEPLLARLEGDVVIARSPRRLGLSGAAVLGAEHARAQTIVLIRGAAAPATTGWLAPLVTALDEPGIGLAASTDAADHRRPVPAAWSVAVHVEEIAALATATIDDELVMGTLALAAAQRGRRVCQVGASTIHAPGTRSGGSRRPPGEPPELTIVIPTLDATAERVRRCLQAIAATTDVAHEIVIVDNGAPPQGFTAPVNAGIRASRSPYVVVMNDDVETLPGWWEPLRATIDAGAAVAFPLTVDGAMRTDFAAWCFAISREALGTFAHSPDEFFDPSLVVWYQDTDLLQTLRRAGRPPVLVREARIRHGLSETVGTEDPELSSWVQTQIAADQRHYEAKQASAESRALARAG